MTDSLLAHPGEATRRVLPDDAHLGPVTLGKVGMWIFLLSDAWSFAGLLIAYGVLRAGASVWRHPGEPQLGIPFTAGLTFLLICSSVSMVLAVAAASQGRVRAQRSWLLLTALGGVGFLLGQAHEYFGIFGSAGLVHEGLVLGQSAYANSFYVITSFHGLHVFAGVVLLLRTWLRSFSGQATSNEVEVVGLFWHFVDLVWILVFTFVYLV